jgi:hypothetical protein
MPSILVKEAGVEVLIFVLALLVLGLAAQVYGADSRPPEPERRRP